MIQLRLEHEDLEQVDRGLLVRMLVEYRNAQHMLNACQLPDVQPLRQALDQAIRKVEREVMQREAAPEPPRSQTQAARPRASAPLYSTL